MFNLTEYVCVYKCVRVCELERIYLIDRKKMFILLKGKFSLIPINIDIFYTYSTSPLNDK